MESEKIAMASLFRIFIGLVAAGFLVGCASNNLYYWGHYEDSIYDMYIEPGKVSIGDEIMRFENQVEKTTSSGKFVPPGLHAHLAYLYISEGDYATALVHLQTEKKKFPESGLFIDGMIERMHK